MTTDAPDRTPDHVYDEIRRGVIEGRFPPGSRLVEQRLAEELSVSRTPVREALRRLEAEGLVTVERNRGAQVRRLTADEIVDLYDVRARLEAYTAELAAGRADAADLAVLDAAVAGFDAAVDAVRRTDTRADARADATPVRPEGTLAHVHRLDDANAAFHTGLLAAAHHTRLPQLVGRTIDFPLVFQALRHFDVDELARSALFHHLIRDAVATAEPTRAGRLMTEHVLQGRDAIVDRLRDTDVVDLFESVAP